MADNKPKANKVNYTPYRKAYSKAKSILVQKHKDEFKQIMDMLLSKNVPTPKK